MGKKRGKKRSKSKNKKRAGGRKVGIVCHFWPDEEDRDCEIRIYVVDIDGESRPPPCGVVEEYATANPAAVRFHFPRSKPVGRGICVLKSTVYFFAGYNPRSWFASETIPEKCGKKFLLSEKVLDQVVEAGQLSSISDMHHAKAFPIAIPTPDRKSILVFASLISVKDSCHAFELYNPRLDSWDKLPGLPWRCWHEPCWHEVTSFGFVGKFQSHFLVEIEEIGSFALSLSEKKWAKVFVPRIPHPPGIDYFLSAKDQYLLTPTRAYNLYDGEGFLVEVENTVEIPSDSNFIHGPPFPLSAFAPPKPPHRQMQDSAALIVPFHPFLVGEQVCNSCVLQMDIVGHEYDCVARILIDVCVTDLTTLETTVSKTVSLRFDLPDYLAFATLVSI